MAKYYFGSLHDEICYPLEYHIDEAKFNGLKEIELYKAIPCTSLETDLFFCTFHQEVGETGNCGKQCNEYQSRNGRSGCCKHFSKRFFEHGEKITIKINDNGNTGK